MSRRKLPGVLVYPTGDRQGKARSFAGGPEPCEAPNSTRYENLNLEPGFGIVVHDGYIVLLVEDANFFQRIRRQVQRIVGPSPFQVINFRVSIIAVQAGANPSLYDTDYLWTPKTQ